MEVDGIFGVGDGIFGGGNVIGIGDIFTGFC